MSNTRNEIIGPMGPGFFIFFPQYFIDVSLGGWDIEEKAREVRQKEAHERFILALQMAEELSEISGEPPEEEIVKIQQDFDVTKVEAKKIHKKVVVKEITEILLNDDLALILIMANA